MFLKGVGCEGVTRTHWPYLTWPHHIHFLLPAHLLAPSSPPACLLVLPESVLCCPLLTAEPLAYPGRKWGAGLPPPAPTMLTSASWQPEMVSWRIREENEQSQLDACSEPEVAADSQRPTLSSLWPCHTNLWT